MRAGGTLSLYWNGILDSVTNIRGSGLPNPSPLYIGNSPLMASQCHNSL